MTDQTTEQEDVDAFSSEWDTEDEDRQPEPPAEDMKSEDAAVEVPPAEKSQGEPEQSEEERQAELRRKEWEGRIRARDKTQADARREEELARREEEIRKREEELKKQEPQRKEDVEEDDEDVKELRETFGDKFVSAVRKASDKEAQRRVDEALQQERMRMHFMMIQDAHEDFRDVVGSSEFAGYVDSMPEKDRAAAQKVIESGTAKQVVKLLSDYKATVKSIREADEKRKAEEEKKAEDERKRAEEDKKKADKGGKPVDRRTPSAAPTGTAPKVDADNTKRGAEDYDSAWDEF